LKLWVTLEGREAEVTFRTEGERLILEADGRRIEADFVRLPDGEVYSLLIDGRSHVVRVSQTAEGLDVELRGMVIPVEVKHPLEKMLQASSGARVAGRGETVSAPMPGVVVAVRVRAGDVVRAGQSVVVVEAMKMQNELAVMHDGIVSEVLVGERAAVSAGQALVRLSAAPAAPAAGQSGGVA
jgi:biotin carboxyl carrier protein